MTRRLMTLLAPLAVCVAALGWTATAQAGKGMELALADDNVFLYGLSNPFEGLDRAKDLHATWIRVNMQWTRVLGSKQSKARKQPRHLNYDWVPYDDIVNRANARGLAVEFTLTGNAPRWASGKRKPSGYKPKASKFGSFSRAVAQHFDGRVKRYSIWNEPNLKQWLSPLRKAPRLYRGLYSSAYRNIKKVNSNNQVLIGETAPYSKRKRTIAPLKFLRGVTCVNGSYRHRRCKGLKTDGYAHHPYDFKHKPKYRYPGKDNVTLGTLSRLTRALSRLKKAKALRTPRGGVPFIYLTEYGYFPKYRGINHRAKKYAIPQSRQAKYLKQAFTIARKNRRVKQMLQYVLVTPPRGSAGEFFATQIMGKGFKPFRAYRTLRSWAAREARRGGIATTP